MLWDKISSHISTRRFFSLYKNICEDIKTILFLRSFGFSFSFHFSYLRFLKCLCSYVYSVNTQRLFVFGVSLFDDDVNKIIPRLYSKAPKTERSRLVKRNNWKTEIDINDKKNIFCMIVDVQNKLASFC